MRFPLRLKALRPAIVFLLCLLPCAAPAGLFGGGGSDQIAPDSVRPGEPVTLRLILDTWGSGGPIKDRYKNIALHYRLKGEDTYHTAEPSSTELPENFRNAASPIRQFEAFAFTIPPYPKTAAGEIEYYFTMEFDGYANTAKGVKPIRIRPNA